MSVNIRTIRCWLISEDLFGSSTEIPVSEATATYSLDEIPTASFLLPVGVNAVFQTDTFKTAAANKAKLKLPVTVYFDFILTDGKGNVTDSFKNKIFFKGYITSLGYFKTETNVAYKITATHQISDLASTNFYFDKFHPSTPSDIIKIYSPDIAVGNALSTIANPGITSDEFKAEVDLWEEGIKPLFLAIANNSGLFVASTTKQKPNETLEQALKYNTKSDKPLSFGALILEGDNSLVNIIEQVNEYCTGVISDPSQGITAWDKLKIFASTFSFHIVAYPNGTWKVIPFIPALNPEDVEPYNIFKSTFISQININTTIVNPITRVIVHAALPNGIFLDSGLTQAKGDTRVLGIYELENSDIEGQTLYVQGPWWMYQDNSSVITADCKKLALFDINSIYNPPAPDPACDEAQKNGKFLMGDAYAKSVFAQEVLAQRNTSVICPFAVGVAPGSFIQINQENTSDQFTALFENKPIYGDVLSVTQSLNARSSTASTIFQVGYTRTAAEVDWCVTEHPIYGEPWLGSSMEINPHDAE